MQCEIWVALNLSLQRGDSFNIRSVLTEKTVKHRRRCENSKENGGVDISGDAHFNVIWLVPAEEIARHDG
jgi:hypothetical protein